MPYTAYLWYTPNGLLVATLASYPMLENEETDETTPCPVSTPYSPYRL